LDVTEAEAREEKKFLEEKYLDLLNWDDIYIEILNYKIGRGYKNLGVGKDILVEIIKSN
jgi:hypothetical protein